MTDRDQSTRNLERLARLWGIQTAYYDVASQLQTASTDAMLRILPELGCPLAAIDEVPAALRECEARRAARLAPPIVVAWDGNLTVPLQVTADHASIPYEAHLQLHTDPEGSVSPPHFDPLEPQTGSLEELATATTRTLDGQSLVVKQLRWPGEIPIGYHTLTVVLEGRSVEVFVMSAPRSASSGKLGKNARLWGVFAPLYAMHTKTSWGSGNFGDLERVMKWIADSGGDLVATLPLLAQQSELSEDPSPYSPGSRLFWNHLYLDIDRLLESAGDAAATKVADDPSTRSEIEELRSQRLVDYGRQKKLQRRILEQLSQSFFADESASREAIDTFCKTYPDARSHAQFQATCEKSGKTWFEWTEPQSHGILTPADYDEHVYHYHLYTQYQVDRQLRHLRDRAEEWDLVWYLDFPLGVNAAGFDVWRNRDLFALGASGGAPPDAFFTKGQNWGFPPLHPTGLRDDRYAYLIGAIRHHLRYAKLLRFDHVMGLYRLYFVPHGLDARDGAYVRYHLDEMLALLSIESHRYDAAIVGENLGTVPPVVNSSMDRHNIGDMYVVQYAVNPKEKGDVLSPVPDSSVASINTHDMPTFAAFWTGKDVQDRVSLDLMTDTEANEELQTREKVRRRMVEFFAGRGYLEENQTDGRKVHDAALQFLGESEAPVVLATLEDLWDELEPQNTPGTYLERPNWRRKLRLIFEEMTQDAQVQQSLDVLQKSRQKAAAAPKSARV